MKSNAFKVAFISPYMPNSAIEVPNSAIEVSKNFTDLTPDAKK
jgi:hypothetical protein